MYQHTELHRTLGPAILGDSKSQRGASLPSVVAAVRRRWTLVAATVVVCAGASLSYGMLATPRYIAYTQLIVDPANLRITERSLTTPSPFSDTLIAQVESQVRGMTSDNVLRRVVRVEKLDQDEEFIADSKTSMFRSNATLRASAGLGSTSEGPTLQAIRALAKRVTAKREERTYVVNVGVSTREPEKSVRLADALVASFLQEQADARAEAASRVATSLGSRVAQLRERVEAAEQRVEEFKQHHNMVAAIGQSVTEQQLVEANVRLGQARAAAEEAQARHDQLLRIQQGRGDPGAIPDALLSTTISNLRAQLAEVLRRLGDLETTRGPRHPELAEVRGQERSLRRQVNEELARIAAVSSGNVARARANAQAAERASSALRAAVTSSSEASVRLRELEREVLANRTVYEAFLNRNREIVEQEHVDTANVRVISRAMLPERRSSPPRNLVLLLVGLSAGLGLGIVLALSRGVLGGELRRTTGASPLLTAAA